MAWHEKKRYRIYKDGFWSDTKLKFINEPV